MNRNIALIWIFTVIVLLLQAAFAYNDLPERIASSFDFNGNPREAGTKESFYLTWLITIFVLNAFVLIMRPIFRWAPASMINVPNRDYWLATPERRAQSCAKLLNMMAGVFSCVNIMLILVFQYIVSVNLHGRPDFPIWIPFLIVPVLMTFPLVWIFRAFRVPKA
ncbi:hypothetical protein C3F09_09335 [candidate division GN15 bacterium]|uniref:DUF1648 domain-containing protein n=1 Tax=candidate division GN15 bacterium TaxID=2072418 RepID=A0A855X4I8_9BACT|nr:MAG: hypothetical protein C3F09_09335 [candidate division GN15 bacterium]